MIYTVSGALIPHYCKLTVTKHFPSDHQKELLNSKSLSFKAGAPNTAGQPEENRTDTLSSLEVTPKADSYLGSASFSGSLYCRIKTDFIWFKIQREGNLLRQVYPYIFLQGVWNLPFSIRSQLWGIRLTDLQNTWQLMVMSIRINKTWSLSYPCWLAIKMHWPWVKCFSEVIWRCAIIYCVSWSDS